jgi:hypothetical protein
MTLRIFKYHIPVPVTEYFLLEIPDGARVLSVDVQHGVPCLWVLCDPDKSYECRKFRLIGTGDPIRESMDQLRFIGTFQMNDGYLIIHVFEV